MNAKFVLGVLVPFLALQAQAAYEIGREMETAEFWKSDPDLFINRHQKKEGFHFTSDAHEQADTRRDRAVFWNGVEAYETRLMFGSNGGVDRVEIVFFNPGGTETLDRLTGADGKPVWHRRRVEKKMSADDFLMLVENVRAKLTPEDAKQPPVAKSRPKNTNIRQFAQTWPKTDIGTVATLTWNYEQGPKRNDPITPAFVRLAVDGPSRAASPARGRSGSGRADVASRSRRFSDNVVKSSNGDVYVDNVPMVDQGAKGYCAVAVTERILRYFGVDVDEHEIAAEAGTTVSGTRTDEMVKTVITLSSRYKNFAVQVVAGDADESDETRIANLGKRVAQYNKTAKRLKKEQIEESVYVRREGNMVFYSPGAAEAAMDPEVLREMKTQGAGKAKYQAFLKCVRKNVEAGLPLMWGVTLGIYSGESGIPQSRGGHMRLIIGISEKKGRRAEILYSDTWGQGHERKSMPADWAWTITDTLLAVRPR